MPDAPGKTVSRRRRTAYGSTTAERPAPARTGAGSHRRGVSARDGKKMAPERSATQNLPASRSGARWQGGRGRFPPGIHALLGKRRERSSFGDLRNARHRPGDTFRPRLTFRPVVRKPLHGSLKSARVQVASSNDPIELAASVEHDRGNTLSPNTGQAAIESETAMI